MQKGLFCTSIIICMSCSCIFVPSRSVENGYNESASEFYVLSQSHDYVVNVSVNVWFMIHLM